MKFHCKKTAGWLLLLSLLGTMTACGRQVPVETGRDTLVVGSAPFSGKFTPFFADTVYDQNAQTLTQIPLLGADREGNMVLKGIEGETRSYNGTDYLYTGPADCTVTENPDGTVTYGFTLRQDLVFSDGVPMTIDDVIFTMYVLSDPSYTGSSTFYALPVVGMEEYRQGAPAIAGIVRTGDYSMTVTLSRVDAAAIYQLGPAIAPLHYYGDPDLYDYENNTFGFPKGDLAPVHEKDTVPLGAGPYVFRSYANGVISYTANEHYYKGCPVIPNLKLQETSDNDKMTGITTGLFDITDPAFTDDTAHAIRSANANGELSGDTVFTSAVDNLGYGYIGINADTVLVGDDPSSQASKNLRKALAGLFAVYREPAVNAYYGERASIIQYPISNTSWAAPRASDEGFKTAYSTDVDGNTVITPQMSQEQREKAALDMAVGYLKAAGYTYDEAAGKFTAAPQGAALEYEIIIPAGGVGSHPSYGILTSVKNALKTIGMDLIINDPADSNELWNALDAGTQELFSAAWDATADPDLYQVYHSANIVGKGGTDSNHYHIADGELDQLIVEARSTTDLPFRKATYGQCLDIILDWAVEIPVYQRKNCVVFSARRVNVDTVTPDMTPFWGWMNDLERLEMM